MNKTQLTLIFPPLSACRYGCAGRCCALPITVFWVSGIIGIVYGLNGGLGLFPGVDWFVLAISAALILISIGWTHLLVNKAENMDCSQPHSRSAFCTPVNRMDESDPFDEIKKAR
jgi:hypothetical protein